MAEDQINSIKFFKVLIVLAVFISCSALTFILCIKTSNRSSLVKKNEKAVLVSQMVKSNSINPRIRNFKSALSERSSKYLQYCAELEDFSIDFFEPKDSSDKPILIITNHRTKDFFQDYGLDGINKGDIEDTFVLNGGKIRPDSVYDMNLSEIIIGLENLSKRKEKKRSKTNESLAMRGFFIYLVADFDNRLKS